MPRFPSVCIMSDAIFDIQQDQYPTVIREMIRHENDVTNHRIMWLLVGQGFIANAYVAVKDEGRTTHSMLCTVGMIVAFSAFLMLYRSYRARGYLLFLGGQAKQGLLQERYLPLMGWPRIRIKGWWKNVWVSPWLGHTGDLFEPWLVLPYLFTTMWMSSLLHAHSRLNLAVILLIAVILSAVTISTTCILSVLSQGKDEESTEG
jgi:hypothetical protein